METKLFDDEKYIDNSLDYNLVSDILDFLAYMMTPQSKSSIASNIRYINYSYKKVVVDKHVDYCIENNLLMSKRKIYNGRDETNVFFLPVSAQLDRLYDISKDAQRLKKVSRYENLQYFSIYGLSDLRDAIFSYFNGKITYLYRLAENPQCDEYVKAMFYDERYFGFLSRLAQNSHDVLYLKFMGLYFNEDNRPSIAAYKTIFIENQYLIQEVCDRYRMAVELFENVLAFKLDDSIEYENDKSANHLVALALRRQYHGDIEAALKYYAKAFRGISSGILNCFAITYYTIALYQANNPNSLKKVERLRSNIERCLPESLPAKIVADLIQDGSVRNHIREYKSIVNSEYISRCSKLLSFTILKQLGETDLIDIPETLFDTIRRDPYMALIRFEMSGCFEEVKSENDEAIDNQGLSPIVTCLSQRHEWEVIMRKMEAAVESSHARPAGVAVNGQRIIYGVTNSFKLFFYKQKWLKSGRWGKAYFVDPYDIKRDFKDLDDVDRKVLGHLRNYYSYDESPFHNNAFVELIGSDKVFRLLKDGITTPVRVEKSEPSIIAKKTKDGIAIHTDINISKAEDGVILKFEDNYSTIKVISFDSNQLEIFGILKDKVVFPSEQEDKLSKILGEINENCKITLQSDLVQTNENIRKIDADTLITGVLRPVEDGLTLKLFVKPLVTAPPYCEPGRGAAAVLGMVDGEQVQAVRSLDVEKKNFNDIKKMLQQNLYLDYTNSIETTGLVNSLLLLELLQKNQDVIRTEWPEGYDFKLAGSADFKNLSISVKSDNQWLDVEGELKVGEDIILKMSELIEKVRESKDRFIKLDDKTFLMLSEQLKKQLDVFASMANIERKKVKLSAFEAFAMEGFEENGTEMQTDKFYRNIVKKIKDADKQTFDIPKGLKAELRDYQEDGYKWMMRLNSWGAGACLADDMGLGKTLQAIAVMLKKADQGPSLVVCPASVLLNWRNELERFAPSLSPLLIHNADKQRGDKISDATDHDIVLVTYGILITEAERLVEKQWNVIVLDEAHTIKNKETKMSKAAMNLKGDFKVILTGTPLQNHLGEIWNLFQFINPGLLGTFGHFTDNYITPIVKNEDKQRQKQLKNRLLPFMLRRTKNDVLDELPEKTEIVLDVNLTEEEEAFYENMRRIAVEKVKESDNAGIQTLAEITRLRQAACNVKLIDRELNLTSSKTETFMELVNELCTNNHRALVFSQFTSHLALIIKRLEEENIRYLYLDGSTPVKERERLVKAFQKSEDIPLFLISMKAGGLGLNLTAADYIIHLDPWWNPAVEDQASDRAYRMGQTRPVTVYRLISKNTIEEKIIRLHQTKKSLADALLDGSDMSHKLTKEEMLELLGAKM